MKKEKIKSLIPTFITAAIMKNLQRKKIVFDAKRGIQFEFSVLKVQSLDINLNLK